MMLKNHLWDCIITQAMRILRIMPIVQKAALIPVKAV
jgi:hypothetical protein